jgi:hypothetical protein
MKMRLTKPGYVYKTPILIRWRTQTAEFLEIEVSPSHIFRIKIDRA